MPAYRGGLANRLYVAGFSQLTISEQFPDPITYDGIGEVHLQSYHLFGRHKYSKGRIWMKGPNDVLDFVMGGMLQDDHTLLVVPNTDLFLSCCRFDYHVKKHAMAFSKSPIKTRLASQEEYGWFESSFFVRSGSTTALKLVNAKRRISLAILDLCNFGCRSLTEYLDMVGELEKIEETKHDTPLSSRQCAAISLDVANSYIEALLRVNQEAKLGGIRFTIGGMALNAAKQASGPDWFEPHGNELANDLERQCYLGGRIESFGSGLIEGPIYHLDISSHYPYQVLSHEHPVRLESVSVNPTVGKVEAAARDFCCFGLCYVRTAEPSLPVRRKGKTIYPIGEFNAYLCGSDFIQGIRSGAIVNIRLLATYRVGRVAHEFLAELLSSRQRYRNDGRNSEELVCKLLANSFIGKTAQIGTAWQPTDKIIPQAQYGFGTHFDSESKEQYDYRVLDWQPEIKIHGIEQAGTFPAFAASVVSYARQHTWRILKLVGLENVYSVCGDGFLLNQAGYRNVEPFIHTGESVPGKLRLVGVSERMEHVSATCYRSGIKTARSGEVAARLTKPADVMQAICEDAGYTPNDSATTRMVIRRQLQTDMDRLFEEVSNRPFRWIGSPHLEETELHAGLFA